ncbi:hypothetical protein NP493_950g00004 [Ridgeia piscesae]|uniref:Importin-7/11-like TPR repeats domain-containing protein n=1 Tax=Ridgeia piscesae TaxID=27915 RepID=A0AAD9NL36_RIDPI|nr:hypothetical protein NP493_950g00004 [Ridgeia piscesae]
MLYSLRLSVPIRHVFRVLQRYSSGLLSSLANLLTDLRTEGVVLVYKLVELVFRVVPEQGPAVFTSMLPNIFKSIAEDQLYPMVASLHLSLFARIILQNQGFFWQFLEHLAKELGTQSSDVLASFLDGWFDKMDGVIETERKKLCSLSLASLLTCNQSVVMQRFASVISVCVEVLHDVCRSDVDTSAYIDALVHDSTEELPEDEQETEHEKRKRLLCCQDPVYTVNLKEYILVQLQACQQQHGEETFKKLIDSVDVEIMQQLQEFMKV